MTLENKLSIIILQYNNYHFFPFVIDTINKQKYDNIEIILVDDCSSKYFTATDAQSFFEKTNNKKEATFKVIVNSSNLGTVKSLNNAIKAASGDYIKIIAVDDAYPSDENLFSKQVSYLLKHTHCQFVLGDTIVCDGDMKPLYCDAFSKVLGKKTIDNPKVLERIIKNKPQFFPIQAMCFRKSFFDDYCFDERFKLIEDLPFIVHVYKNSIKFGYESIPSVLYRGQVGTSSNNEAFSINKLTYYNDLLNYYLLCLHPIRNRIGKVYVWMRTKVLEFRIEYTKTKKKRLYLKYFFPLFLFAVSNFRHVSYYFKKRNHK